MAPKFGVSYFGNRFVSHAQNDLHRIAGCCDYVVHTVSESDMTFHKSVLSRLLGESRKRNLQVWVDPWGLGGVFGGEAFSRFLIDHRDSWQVMSDGQIRPMACFNRPEWKSYVREWILTVRDMGAQVIFWDEPHMAFDLSSEFEGFYSCTCVVCRDLFKKNYGEEMPTKMNELTREFRRNMIRSFLSEMMEYAKSKELINALCLYALKGYKEYDQIWEEAAALKDLDIFGSDPYWRWRGKHDPSAHVAEYAKKVVNSARQHGKQSQIWLQAMRLPVGHEIEIDAACEAAIQQGVTHVAAWSFDGGELLDTVLAEDPKKVWEQVERTFKRFRSHRTQ